MVKLKSFRWGIAVILTFILAAFVAQVALMQDNTGVTFEVVGTIEAVDASSITVNGQIIDITSAEISTGLDVGLAVRVHGTVLADGRIVASEVSAAQNGDILPNEIEVVGLWPAVVSNTVVIGGVTFDLSSAEIDANIVAGDLVVVHATLSPDGVWVVREVQLFNTDDNNNDNANQNDNSDDNGNQNDNSTDNVNENQNDNADDNGNDNVNTITESEFELTGTLQSIGDGSIVVSSASIDTRSAEIHGTLIVGALVKVHVTVVDGQLVAREVALVSQGNGSNDNANDNQNDNNDNADDNGNDNGNDNNDDNGNDNSGNVVIPDNCVPSMPAGWTTYTVQSGDTLSSIAARTGAGLGDLMQANCIANPSIIAAGANIFVPRTPDPVGNGNNNDNADDHGNDNGDDHGNDNGSVDDHGNDNGNDNSDDHGGGSNDNGGHGGDD